jgi:drug/metabolite transporter (DMT)-like permease
MLLALLVATLGGAWFIVRLLHWRFRPTFEPVKVWRQSVWVALFVAIGAWLQLNRALTWAIAALAGGVLVLLEAYLNVRER